MNCIKPLMIKAGPQTKDTLHERMPVPVSISYNPDFAKIMNESVLKRS